MAILLERELNGGVQILHKFKNGYGASVVRHEFSYGGSEGLWELAVIKFTDGDKWLITYDTEITEDVLRYLTGIDVDNILNKIEKIKG